MKRILLISIVLLGFLVLVLLDINLQERVEEFDRNYLLLDTPDFPDEGYGIHSLVWNTENQITIQGLADWDTMPIAVVDSMLGDVYRIDNYLGYAPTISPNQKYIAFCNYSEGNILIVKNEYPYEVQHIIDGLSYEITWSAESDMIYWTTSFGDKYGNDGMQIHSYNLVTQIQEYYFDYQEENITDGEGISLSPDGKKLIFSISKTRTREKYFQSSDIVLVSIESGEIQKITNSLELDERYPEWFSNDIITYRECDMRSRCRNYYLVFYDLETNCSRTVRNANNYKNPSWAADRSALAYLSAERFIYIIPVEDILPVDNAHEWICEK